MMKMKKFKVLTNIVYDEYGFADSFEDEKEMEDLSKEDLVFLQKDNTILISPCTCNECPDNKKCPHAFDAYNYFDDCVAIK
jgi:hypothetical protein